MTYFLLTSTVNMGILLAVYYFLLQKEKTHHFNRFYLLGALCFSLVVPFIAIPVHVVPQLITSHYINVTALQHEALSVGNNQHLQPQFNYWPYVVLGVYLLITILLAVKFAVTVLQFNKIAQKNRVISYKGATLVIVKDSVVPHTFLRKIYISQNDYENRHATPELLDHELVHANQLHTLDVLFAETLKTIFWFNPMVYIYKWAIQLNHEFLADDTIIKTTQNVIAYQRLLLEKASRVNEGALASNFNFFVTKKRLIMMTKTTSAARALVLQLLPFPVIIALLFCFGTQQIVAQTKQVEIQDLDPLKIESITTYDVTKAELDSLNKVNPAIFTGSNTAGYSKMVATYTDEKGKTRNAVSFLKAEEFKLGASSGDGTKSLIIKADNVIDTESLMATQEEIDALKKSDPEKYKDATKENVIKNNMHYKDNNGNKKIHTTYVLRGTLQH